MKIKILATIIVALFVTLNSNAQVKVLSTGALRFGNTSQGHLIYDYTGYNGNGPALYPSNSGCSMFLGKSNSYFCATYSGSFYTMSDANFKENIQDITNALKTVLAMKGVKFDYTAKMFNNDKNLQSKLGKNKVGFIAQDLQKVLPQAVGYDDSTGIYSVDYTKVIPILVEAIKEQQNTIDALAKKVNGDTKTVKSLNEVVDINNTENLVPYLAQNAPNPFNQSTEIAFYLSEETQKAVLNIYDMNGTQIKSIAISQKGKGSVTIQAAELHPGMYMYSLIADGKEIDTKRMILTD